MTDPRRDQPNPDFVMPRLLRSRVSKFKERIFCGLRRLRFASSLLPLGEFADLSPGAFGQHEGNGPLDCQEHFIAFLRSKNIIHY
jgi:hypothetical protein